MKIENVLICIKKDNFTYYLLKTYLVFESGKRFNCSTAFLSKSQFIKLGGKI